MQYQNPVKHSYRFIATLCFSLIVTLFSAGTPITSHAAPGGLDLTFSGDGKLLDGVLSHGLDRATGVAVQPDGKIVVVGGYRDGFAVARYNSDGTLDPAFGDGGRATTPFSAQGVAIQSDGKIVVGGNVFQGSNHLFALHRYNPDGSHDATFDSDGTVITPMGPVDAYLLSIAIHTDGKIVGAGYIVPPSHQGGSFALARYNPNGSLDTSFDGDGKVITAVGGLGSVAWSVAIQPDGKIVAAGEAGDFALVRYNLNGSLDTSFDSDGIVKTPFGLGGSDRATSVSIQPDGKIVAAGYAYGVYGTGVSKFALARYDSNGSPDTTFDSDGMVTTSIGSGFDGAHSVAIQPDGKIVAGGYSGDASNTNYDLAAVRYNANGSLDTTFDSDGILTTAIDSDERDRINSLAIQPNGKIVGVGDDWYGNHSIIVRYDSNGSLDTAFDGDGLVITRSLFFDGNALHDVAIQPDGKIVAAGGADRGLFAVARYNSDGTRDTTFGGTGTVVQGVTQNEPAKAIAVQADGKIVAAGTDVWDSYDYRFVLTRYNADGSRDASFGDNGGWVSTHFSSDSYLNDVAIQSDGKIVAAGSVGRIVAPGTVGTDFALVRYNTDGSLDTSFGGDGIVMTPIGAGNAHASSVVLQNDGKIVASGLSSNGFTVVRYDPNGALDSSFGTGGIVTTLTSQYDAVDSAVLQPDGKIIVAGSAGFLTSNDDPPGVFVYRYFALIRYNPNGSLDTTFGTGGVTSTLKVALGSETHAVALQPDGRIVAAGSDNYVNFVLLRFNANGSLDPSFAHGIPIADFEGSNDYAHGLALDNAGRAVVVGESEGRFALARFLLTSRTPFDYDGDQKADVSVYRPDGGDWWIKQPGGGYTQQQWGNATDRIAPADYDGDGKTDIAVFRPDDGNWWVLSSLSGTFSIQQWGDANDVIVPGDYTGDGKADYAVWRPSSGEWYIRDISNGQFTVTQWGNATDRPVPADYDGNGAFDIMAYRPSEGNWYLRLPGGGYTVTQWGDVNDKLVPADYNGDGSADLAVWRPSSGNWYIRQPGGGFDVIQWGNATDLPTPADYDGNGETNIAIWRPEDGVWWILNDTGGGFTTTQWGSTGDRPTPNAYVR